LLLNEEESGAEVCCGCVLIAWKGSRVWDLWVEVIDLGKLMADHE
jgi:hypothetical protein